MDTDNLFEEILGIPGEDTTEGQIMSEIVPDQATEVKKRSITPYEERAPMPTKIEKAQRIEDVAELLLKLKSNTQIKTIIAQKYGISPETVRNDIVEANKLIQSQVPEIKSVIAKNLESYRRIAEESEPDDKRTALLALNSMEKLLRLHNPETQNLTQVNLNFESIDSQELIELIKQLKGNQG